MIALLKHFSVQKRVLSLNLTVIKRTHNPYVRAHASNLLTSGRMGKETAMS